MPTDHPYAEDRNPPAKGRVIQLSTVHAWDDNRICRKISRSLVEAGYDVTLIARPPKSQDSIPPSDVILEVLPPVRGRVWRGITSLFIWNRLRRLHPEVVHFHDPELIPSGIIMRILGCKVIYDVHEDVPDDILRKDWLPTILRGFLSLTMRSLEWIASRIFSLNITATEHILRRFPREKSIVVRNYPRLEESPTKAPSDRVNQGGLLYVGGLDADRGTMNMIAGLDSASYPGKHLDLVGACDDSHLMKAIQERADSGSITMHGWLSREGVVRALANARAGLVLLRPTPAYVESLPTKMFEYMSAGLPVIASDFPTWSSILGKYKCGIMVDPEDSDSIGNAIDWIYDNPDEAAAMGARGKLAIEHDLNWQSEARRLLGAYSRLHERRASPGL